MLGEPGAVGIDVRMRSSSERLGQVAVGAKGSIWQSVNY